MLFILGCEKEAYFEFEVLLFTFCYRCYASLLSTSVSSLGIIRIYFWLGIDPATVYLEDGNAVDKGHYSILRTNFRF